MKYLNSYKLFELYISENDDVEFSIDDYSKLSVNINDIKNICLDMEDRFSDGIDDDIDEFFGDYGYIVWNSDDYFLNFTENDIQTGRESIEQYVKHSLRPNYRLGYFFRFYVPYAFLLDERIIKNDSLGLNENQLDILTTIKKRAIAEGLEFKIKQGTVARKLYTYLIFIDAKGN